MRKDLADEVKWVLDRPISVTELSDKTGVNAGTISRLRSGERDVENITLQTTKKFISFKDECSK